MTNDKNIFGCFAMLPMLHSVYFEDNQKVKELAAKQGEEFRSYIWGEKGICDLLKKLNYEDYGQDLILILFQFYVNQLPIVVINKREIEYYRKKEKSIGIPIIINNNNFFGKSEKERYLFLKEMIFKKLELLTEKIRKKKLDTKIELLKSDLMKLWDNELK